MFPNHISLQDSWRCNFLGLAPEVDIPSHVLSSDLFVLLDITSSTNEVKCFSLRFHSAGLLEKEQKDSFVLLKEERKVTSTIRLVFFIKYSNTLTVFLVNSTFIKILFSSTARFRQKRSRVRRLGFKLLYV